MKKLLFILTICFAVGCKSKLKPREMGAYDYKTSCVSNNNGNLVVSTWGTGTDKKTCKKNALKKAITDVVFKGIIDGNIACQQPPILNGVNAQKQYQSFFDSFLSDTGKYVDYATIYDEPRSQSHSKKVRKLDRVENLVLEFQVAVNRTGLVKLLQQESILKQ